MTLGPLPALLDRPNVRVLAPTLDDPNPWLRSVLGDGPATTRTTTTTQGWPLQIVWGPDAVVAVYTFWDRTAAVALVGERDVDAVTLEAFSTVEPDWTSEEPRVIDELWTTPVRA